MLPHSLPELTPAAPRDSALKCRGGGRRGVHVSVAPPNLERCGEHGGGRGPVHWPLSTAPPGAAEQPAGPGTGTATSLVGEESGLTGPS